jgi:DNA-binding FadR family transcriptional regulator
MTDDQLMRAQAGLEQRAAAHAAFFTVLAEAAAGNPAAAALLASGGELARELMIAAGRGCDGIVVNSRRRFLDCLRSGDPGGAARELEDHLATVR